MAIALIVSGGALAASTGTTLAVTGFGSTLPVGTLIVLGVTNNAGAGVTTCVDNSTQAGTANSYTIRTRVASGSSTMQVVWCVLTRSLLSTDSITVTMGSASRRAMRVMAFSGAAATSPIDKTASASTVASPLTVGPTAVLAQTGELAVCMRGWVGGAVASGFADSSGFTALSTSSGGVTPRVEAVEAYKLGVGTAAVTDSMTFTSMTGVSGELLTFKPVGGTAFNKSVSGAVSFVGVRPVMGVQRKVPSVLSFSGAEVAHPTARKVTGALSFSGGLTPNQILLRTLTAVLHPTGALSTATAYVRSLVGAVLHPTGAISSIKAVSKSVSGALSFVGSQSHQDRKALTGTLTPTGSLARALTLLRTLTASVGFSGSVSRRAGLPFSAALSWVGMVSTSAKTSQFFASFHPTGTVTHGLPMRTLFAALNTTATLARFTTRQLVASLVASGVMHTQYIPPVPAGEPGGGGYGALMSDAHFRRYNVASAWRGVKRVKV